MSVNAYVEVATRKAIKLADTSGPGAWRTIKGRKVFIKEGQSVEDALGVSARTKGMRAKKIVKSDPDYVVARASGKSHDEATADAIKALIKKEKKPNVFYRGGGEGSMPRGQTAADVLNYEKEELGNSDVKVEPGIDPKKIKSDNLVWLTTTKSAARNYGTATKQELKNYKIIARDGEDGVLVEKLKD